MRDSGWFLSPTIYLLLAGLLLISGLAAASVSAAEEFYPSYVLLRLRAENRIIEQDPFFEILDYGDYILLPLAALSRYLDLELDYRREDDRLFVHYPETGIHIEVDLQRNSYPGYPEWDKNPPRIYEGDFYVSPDLIERITGGFVEWLPRRQEIIFDYDDFAISEEEQDIIIRERPETPRREPDVVGSSFSLGSLQYRTGLSYGVGPGNDFLEGNLYSGNNIYLHGRAGNWALSLGQNINYDFQDQSFQIYYPLIRAINRENNRLLVLGDYTVNFTHTRVSDDLRGVYVQYPRYVTPDTHSYISVSGAAEPGSTVYLYLNEELTARQYIYQGEQSYRFGHLRLISGRTNTVQVVIEDKEGQIVEEITETIAGSPHIYEDSVQQVIFYTGQTREASPSFGADYLGGIQVRYALTGSNSLFWEFMAGREDDDSTAYAVPVSHLLRLAHRSGWPLVLTVDWLAGGNLRPKENYSIEELEHGVRFNVLYTLNRGSISFDLDYVSPGTAEFVLTDVGHRMGLDIQHQIGNFWMLNLGGDTVTGIGHMPEMSLYRGRFSLNYRDLSRNAFNLGSEYGWRDQILFWQPINAYESGRDWLSIFMGGKTQIGSTDLNGDLKYKVDWINFLNTEDTLRFETADAELGVNFRLTDNLVAGMELESTASWLEGRLQKQGYILDTRARRGTENSLLTLGAFTEQNRDLNSPGFDFEENRRELYAQARYFPTIDLTFRGELRDTYLHMLNDNYLTAGAGINYINRDQNWQLDMGGSYRTPVGLREIPQEELSVKFTKDFATGQKLTLAASRDYRSVYQSEPSYNLSLNLSHSLGFVKDKITGQRYSGEEHRSYIKGVVYLDEQGTGVRDTNDPLLSGITIYREGSRAVTNDRGEFEFVNVRPGLHEVGIDIDNLSAEYDIITEEKTVQIRENENSYLEFGVTMTGTVSGRVFVDRELTGVRKPGDDPVVMVGLEIEELGQRVYTGSDGSFYFEKVPLGVYTLSLLEDTLPAALRVYGTEEFTVTVTEENLNIRDIDIPLVYGIRR